MDGAPAAGLRERRRASVRREIAICAADLFARQGIAGTTAEQIAAAAGISLRTFYRHCPSKEEALTVLVEENTDEFLAEFRRRPADEPLSVAASETLIHTWANAPGDTRRIVRLMLGDPVLRARWVAGVRRAQELLVPVVAERLGDDPDALRPTVVAGLLLNLTSTVLEYWVTRDQVTDLADMVNQAREILRTLD
ncbi:bacterial regulatory s, tetR family protein [Mycolicibacterium hassiacum DSM 44199]|uniref:Bacterial regulatory s, tetR family protein n=1 Tax=Mycolicibacterium hassiacum (strain DSM 44199 / CIP 105218 / JCM 12690 / 3849) TaxID=1122247 RepID=K5BCL5_MYCHD|nr:bacterial regulatory s, tetR family protein [Mycolicibacterium hassiacum DSM 44199]MBX5486472.1 TetR family transcriptional regulator [Mycolicibacterium hassiacum]MDA4084253.1 TetR family transcriptional regulator [Mycolicibacterium hassiacum DSM 44199]PZN25363.1 MAG: TetR family transcriptional regulator [Mycolicibacterium hassiacum]